MTGREVIARTTNTAQKRNANHPTASRAKSTDTTHITRDDNDDDMWVEKNIVIDGEWVCTRVSSCDRCSHQVLSISRRPTAESLRLASHAQATEEETIPPPTRRAGAKLQRDEWMLLPPSDEPFPSSSFQPLTQQFHTGDESYMDTTQSPFLDHPRYCQLLLFPRHREEA